MGYLKKFDKPGRLITLNNTLTSGITLANTDTNIATLIGLVGNDGINYTAKVRVNPLKKAISADAALAFGEHIFTFPLGVIRPKWCYIYMSSTTASGLSATAGEVGLGTVIGSGANATLGAVGATSEDIMEGTTLSNHVAATELVSRKYGHPVAYGDHGAAGSFGVLDGSATAKKCYLNIASTWDQTAAESVTFSGIITVNFDYMGTGLEV